MPAFICHGLGDWGNPDNELARENIETAFLYADAKTMAEFAELLGRHEDAEELSAFAEAVKENYKWYYNGLAGICPLMPGFRKVLVKPWMPSSMNHLKCVYHSVSGDICVEMDRRGEGIDLRVAAADGIEVHIDRSFL